VPGKTLSGLCRTIKSFLSVTGVTWVPEENAIRLRNKDYQDQPNIASNILQVTVFACYARRCPCAWMTGYLLVALATELTATSPGGKPFRPPTAMESGSASTPFFWHPPTDLPLIAAYAMKELHLSLSKKMKKVPLDSYRFYQDHVCRKNEL